MNGFPFAFFGIPPDGTTDQVLAKKSNSSYDVEWKDNASLEKQYIARLIDFNGHNIANTDKLIIGQTYFIDTYVNKDDFTNVGGTNTSETFFVATASTPAVWSNGSNLTIKSENINIGVGPITLNKIYLIESINAGDDFSNLISLNNPFDYTNELHPSPTTLENYYYANAQPNNYSNGTNLTDNNYPVLVQKNDTGITFYFTKIQKGYYLVTASAEVFNQQNTVVEFFACIPGDYLQCYPIKPNILIMRAAGGSSLYELFLKITILNP